ncbi:MAG: D-glycerate dehydrogenase [Hyphomicrobiales bacterium]|nr:D-glycerate dehydrogenase [Hyphomicrobiales bacterium]MCP5370400.1 D-glycerate dehydrogenase [Hyphomicrobiales bacterium]
MSRPKILLTRRLPDAVQARAQRDYDATLNPGDDLMDAATIAARAAGMDGLLVTATEAMNADAIAALPDGVRIIATFSVGYEHIDLAAAKARGIAVTNTPEVLNDATADIAMLLLLAAARRATEGQAMVRQSTWSGWTATDMLGAQVTGQRLGILGMGGIGQAVARRARGFDMEIHYHNRTRLPAELEQGATYHETVRDLFAASRFLSLHCPLTPETRHVVNAESIEWLPPGAIVVNTARGPVVDDEALIAALKSGRLGAAGLDVFEGEPKVNAGYLDLDNAFLLPHMGSATVETRDAMGFRALDNLDAFFAGGTPRDRLA